ncbi:PAS domain-containing protein [Sphingopyxis granuli]|uniref:PAS domain-containing protein n=1 Tax=Sphingopyxis granuli TaxID=267128 RepID=UPI001F532DC5|nr:PAS domain-containing protein [Sphingopyxis granuli]UNK78422.1 PAS domain-containing protein [Sphingopyxis granuli]
METVREPQRVPAAEFIRGFANWRLQASRKPVVVTHHGKDAHVLISLADYRRLDGRGEAEGRDAMAASQAALIEAIRDAVILVDRTGRVAGVNPAAADLLERAATALMGRPLPDVLPGFARSVLFAHFLRMLDHRERFSGEVPGLIEPQRWLRVDLVPLPIGGAMVLRDISDAWGTRAEQDARRALADAVEIDGTIGVARVSVREAVEAANPALAAMIGAKQSAIPHLRFSALLAAGQRHAFTEAFEGLFRTGDPVRIASELVTRGGGVVPVTLAMVERRSAYASDGAIILAVRR